MKWSGLDLVKVVVVSLPQATLGWKIESGDGFQSSSKRKREKNGVGCFPMCGAQLPT